MDEHFKRLADYYARLPHQGFEVEENEIIGDRIIVDENPTSTSRGRFVVGNMYRFIISIWGVSEESLSWCKDFALRKIYAKIDKNE